MEIKDLGGISKPLEKLIEVIAQGIGAVSQPYLTRKNADAEAYALRNKAEAIKDFRGLVPGTIEYKSKDLLITSNEANIELPEVTALADRAMQRFLYQQTKR